MKGMTRYQKNRVSATLLGLMQEINEEAKRHPTISSESFYLDKLHTKLDEIGVPDDIRLTCVRTISLGHNLK